MKNPKVSVVMPVNNREPFICSAINSLLNQTFKDFELIIVDDGSTDNTVKLIKQYNDNRIVLIQNKKRLGIANSRNIGYKNAKGEYIAISDSDDINLPNRLERQAAFLDSHRDVDVVSCWIKEFDENKNAYIIKYSSNNDIIRANLVFNPSIPAFMMFRKDEIVKCHCLYHDESFEAAVDYEWYTSLPANIKISYIAEPLYLYRRHNNQISTNGFNKQQFYANKIRVRELAKIGIIPTEEELKIHYFLSFVSRAVIDKIDFNDLFNWCEKLIAANDMYQHYNQLEFEKNVLLKAYGLIERMDIYEKNIFDLFNRRFGKSSVFPNHKINIHAILRKILKNDKAIMVFGTKRLGYLVKKELDNKGIFIQGFLDNKTSINNKVLDGAIIRNPSRIDFSMASYTVIVTILSESRFEVKSTLIKEYGLKTENVLTIDDFLINN
ncbi:glycosyltransferase family 2 protein [Niallia circulans]|uniref:glycosyltransferase family 2 protein n=1 Tax=Niallia circulans TaxID=1397 RepID=UPI003524E910